jgi:hypothetical protein
MADLLQILAGTSLTVTETFQLDGTPSNVDAVEPTLTLYRPDDAAYTPVPDVLDTWAGPPARTTGQYRFVMPRQVTPYKLKYHLDGIVGGQPQTLKGWVEWVGASLFTIPAFRAMKVAGGTPFATTATPKYEDVQIHEVRTAILDEFEEILGFSPVPRFGRATLDGNGRTCLILPGLKAERVLSVTVNGVAQTATNYQIGVGNQIEAISNYGYGSPFTAGRRNVTVEWVHGWDRVKGIGGHIAMIWAGAQLNPSGFSSASTISMPDGSTYTYEPSETGRGGFRRPSGIRQADRWFDLHAAGSAAVA